MRSPKKVVTVTLPDGSIAVRMTMKEMLARIDAMVITDEVLASFQEAVDRGPTGCPPHCLGPKPCRSHASVLAQPWCGNDPRLVR